MPVPTETYRPQRILHAVFAISAVILLGSVLWLVMADYNREWRQYQRQGRLWQAAMTTDAAKAAMDAQKRRQLTQRERQIDELEAALPHEQIAEISQRIEDHKKERASLTLPAAAVKGEIGPKIQELERARLVHSDSVADIQHNLDELQADYLVREHNMVSMDQDIAADEDKLRELKAEQDKVQKQIEDLLRPSRTAEEKLAKLDPRRTAWVVDKVRNAPLLDWFNPSEAVQQLVIPEIRTDLNFLTVETIDRCNTCHVNIEDPAFEENNLLLFAERQLASYEGQDVNSIAHPVVLLPFWEEAAVLAGLNEPLDQLRKKAFDRVNEIRSQAGSEPLGEIGDLAQEFDRIAKDEFGTEDLTRGQWYVPLERYLLGIKQTLLTSIGGESFDGLRDMYRHHLVDEYNVYREEQGLAEVSASRVLLGHPRLDLYLMPESPHPARTMGCTACHEGSGQEADFLNVAHSPNDVWVDAQTGKIIPEFLLDHSEGDHGRDHASAKVFPGLSLDGASVAVASVTHGENHVSQGQARSTHQDLKLTDPSSPAPFAPRSTSHVQVLAYHDPAEEGHEAGREAIPMSSYWAQNHGWHAIHYMHWEKPMHRRSFVQSSCNKCHTEIFDIDQAAPKLFEGRLLFAQMGCVNCHATETLSDDLDIKRAGPSLAHVKEKLSASMIASWIWSPKAFRPTTKMPHYFMLENNSSPVDILRTRTEVAAMAHYLLKAKPGKDAKPSAYEPEVQPEDVVGDPKTGRRLFNRIGCLACHTNMDEHGEQWIVEDLVDRTHITDDEAQNHYEQMSYNQRHWYVMEHQADKLQRTGPELSAVGTKLKAGRDGQQAAQWLYDWLRHPQHYSDYSIMPSFRLSEQEAADIAAYLLTLERPEYEPVDFLSLDKNSERMLAELVAQLKAASSTLGMAREIVDEMDIDAKLTFLGKKMIGHYGCNGCHLINGFETASSTCTNLDDWGLKDPHKLDFGYFDHAFDHVRKMPIEVWKVDHEGLDSDAPQVTHDHAKVQDMTLAWEHLSELERRPWLYHKLHNPRVYDRGRTAFEGDVGESQDFNVDKGSDVGQPYNKLKMPKFFLTDRQVEALVTFVTSIRKPLVSLAMQQEATDDDKMRLVRGRQMATRLNCYGCHQIEDNTPYVWEYFDVFQDDGSFNYEHLNNAPPRLVGQGSKTQPQWLHGFLQDVYELRPWLKIRMPSFSLSSDESTTLVGYFIGASQELSQHVTKAVTEIDAYRTTRPNDDRWYASPSLAQPLAHLHAVAMMADLVRPQATDPYESEEAELAGAWQKLVDQIRFLQQTNDVPYPYTSVPHTSGDEQWFARGEALFRELRCYQCHALGDEEKLLALWKMDNPDAEAEALSQQDADDDDEGYDDYGDDEEGYDDEGYGDDEELEEVPLGPVYTAPNLSYTAARLNWDWVDRWLQDPASLQSGTKMPQWFPRGHSAFANYPGSAKKQKHSLYGYDGKSQRQLLMDFIYEAGRRRYTPGHERLMGMTPPKVTLTPLPEPEIKLTDQASSGEGEPAAATVVEAEPMPAVEVKRPDPQQAKVSTIDLHDGAISITAQGKGRVVGVVRFEGKRAKRKPIRMGADAFCHKRSKGRKVLNEKMVVNKDGSMQNVFIYLKSGLSGPIANSKEPAVLDQTGCMYVPHVLGVMTGQPVVIINSDNTLHNVKMNAGKNGAFNEGMPVAGMRLDKVFSKPELGIPLKCDVHPWMGAFIHVVDNPFFNTSDVEGRFEITGLPPGTYTFEAVHENKKISSTTFEVTIEADTSKRMDVTLR